jgi:hypothetical protein
MSLIISAKAEDSKGNNCGRGKRWKNVVAKGCAASMEEGGRVSVRREGSV